MFTFLLGLVAFLVAVCGAFFSIHGLATLYSGQFIAVCIMGSSLEIGKIIATSYLQRYWLETSKLLKVYLISAILVLSGITSLGIFGFLSVASQKNLSAVETFDSQLNIENSKKELLIKEIGNLNNRITTLNSAREAQEKRLPSMSRISAKPIYEDIAKSGEEILSYQEKINKFNSEINIIDEVISGLVMKKSQFNDINTLQQVANIFNIKTEILIKWFTLFIVLVFDPLAISLVIAYNNLIKNKIYKKTEEKSLETLDLSDQQFSKTARYRK